ncbi:PAS domain-containing protein [Helicobacter sp. WB40]|uniref:PAS domain-containing protein n=1 Tax=Helicobacter sp. WB40 TaxID=3004130 RepID=UPI0022EBFF72|nr:PAS domain-containing protein [Helicobacter sp. WB40]MDA3966729.1 PAS domain-containing protein [Helicobacter sp. WB40]
MEKEMFLADDTLITSKTDLKGRVTYGNSDFIDYGEYKENEFLNKPHNIIRHNNMPKIAFKALWDTLKEGKEFFAFVCNKSKHNKIYWVFANVTPSLDNDGNIVGYYSVRRRPSKAGVETMNNLYSKLLDIERTQGLQASSKFVENLLKEHNMSWNELMICLQNQGKESGYR